MSGRSVISKPENTIRRALSYLIFNFISTNKPIWEHLWSHVLPASLQPHQHISIRTASPVPLRSQSVSEPIKSAAAQLWDLVLAPLLLFNSLESSQLKNQTDKQAGITGGVRSDWRTLCNLQQTAPLQVALDVKWAFVAPTRELTSYTWMLCFCFKQQGSGVTFSCWPGTPSVPCHLMPAFFKCLSQHLRSKGEIKALM